MAQCKICKKIAGKLETGSAIHIQSNGPQLNYLHYRCWKRFAGNRYCIPLHYRNICIKPIFYICPYCDKPCHMNENLIRISSMLNKRDLNVVLFHTNCFEDAGGRSLLK